MIKNKNKKGFTLAETLITLSVIGVVSVLTIPNLVMQYQQNVTIAKLKKTHSVLNQALKMAINEYGEVEGWNTKTNIFTDYIMKYMSNVTPIKSYSINNLANSYRYDFTNVNYTYYQLADGNVLVLTNYLPGNSYDWSMNYAYYILVDINGKSGPNVAGHDVYTFLIPSKSSRSENRSLNTVLPEHYYLSYSQIISDAKSCPSDKSQGTTPYAGRGCLARLMKNDWKFDEDYPW